MEYIKVLIADDQKLFREGIRSMLEKELNIHIEFEVSNGLEIMKKLGEIRVDIILMDIDMPGMNGIEATKMVRQKYPTIKVLILSGYDDLKFILEVMRAGASGYLLKNSGNIELVYAIKALAMGNSYYSKTISEKLCQYLCEINNEGQDEMKLMVNLTKREAEVLFLISKEFTNQEIADQLFISTNTVFTHRKNLLKKLNARNTAGLIKQGINSGLIP